MEIVAATQSLAGIGGSETYVVTVADHLQRLGHDVWMYTQHHGRATDVAKRLGLRVARDEQELPRSPDVLIVQDGVVACELAVRYPLTPQVFVAHSDIVDLQLPPALPDLTAVVVTLYDRVDKRIRALSIPHEIVRLTQPVDVERFKPGPPLRKQPRVAMTLGNYVHGERLALLQRACARTGIELRHVGLWSEGGAIPSEQALNQADIVFGKARVIYEAMACGRAAYVFDHNGGDGWVTEKSYELLSPDNFGGQTRARALDEERLVADLAEYHHGMGIVNRDLAVARHSATRHAAALADVLARVAPRSVPLDAPLRELARLVRIHFRADAQTFQLRGETQALGARVHELEAELERSRVERERLDARVRELEAEQTAAADPSAPRAQAELDAAHAAAARSAEEVGELKATRRWRTVQAVLLPADRLRATRQRRNPR